MTCEDSIKYLGSIDIDLVKPDVIQIWGEVSGVIIWVILSVKPLLEMFGVLGSSISSFCR